MYKIKTPVTHKALVKQLETSKLQQEGSHHNLQCATTSLPKKNQAILQSKIVFIYWGKKECDLFRLVRNHNYHILQTAKVNSIMIWIVFLHREHKFCFELRLSFLRLPTNLMITHMTAGSGPLQSCTFSQWVNHCFFSKQVIFLKVLKHLWSYYDVCD